MSFKKNILNCEILTKYKPSLVCTVAAQDIGVSPGNKIVFKGVGELVEYSDGERHDARIGADLNSSFGNVNLRGRKGEDRRGDDAVILVSGLREGHWADSNYGSGEKDLMLRRIKIEKYGYAEADENPHRLGLLNQFQDRFSANNLVLTKDMISAKLPSNVQDVLDKIKGAHVGPDVGSEDLTHEGVKINWYPHSLGGHGGSDFKQVQLIVEDGKPRNIKEKAELAIREANSFDGPSGKSTHNNLIFDRMRMVL